MSARPNVMTVQHKWYCQNVNCGAKVAYNITAGGTPTCSKCGGTWIGNMPPKPITVDADGTRGIIRGR